MNLSKSGITGLTIALAIILSVTPTVEGSSLGFHLKYIDRLAVQLHRLEENTAGFDRQKLFGASRNLFALADRWSEVRAQVEEMAPRVESFVNPDGAGETRFARAGKPISNVTLNATRYTGYTQSGTSIAWCGSSIAVVFTDTGSEIKTLAANNGISAIGVSASANRGGAFTYIGNPSPALNVSQILAGDPVAVCADAATFYYSAIWADVLDNISGVAVAKSSNGGNGFGAPIVVVGKSASTHLLSTDWLAIDRGSPSHLYAAYVDNDFSGAVCGTDPGTGFPVMRYAIEMVNSSDGGSTWSKSPVGIDQVCADAASPNASLAGPRVAVGPQNQVYVVYEASGENGGGLTSRRLKMATSIDGANTFSPPASVISVTPIGDGADLQGFIRANEFPSLAIGTGSKNGGFLYLTWSDAGNVAPDMLSTTSVYGFADVKFMSSTNGGATWSNPVRVNNNAEGGGAPLTDQFEPAIATDKTGRIAICFYDRRRDPNNFLMDRECATSTNDGVSWSNTKMTATNFPSLVGQDIFVAPDYLGDYDTVASDGTNQRAGFMESYGSEAAGNPNVMTSKF